MISVLVAAAAVLLVVSGVAKIRHPEPASALVRRLLHRPRERYRSVLLVRGIGVGELAVGTAALAAGSRTALALLAAAYVGFAVVAVLALRDGAARTPCGCFGSADSPLGPAHLVLDAVAAVAGVAGAVRPSGPALGLLDGAGLTAAVACVQVLLLASLGYLAVTSLPALLAARRALLPSTTPLQEPR
ncbi:MauE/DoxX family redox-associated membrane protein [uncultured Jatrophihabitans sp.]|uniref:MauE/DoxX family redox-associated membrane protein n=1 Tax=uncultured Jatrophihabitans sp. TaxID=1610747 RepID=UPI0035CAA800